MVWTSAQVSMRRVTKRPSAVSTVLGARAEAPRRDMFAALMFELSAALAALAGPCLANPRKSRSLPRAQTLTNGEVILTPKA